MSFWRVGETGQETPLRTSRELQPAELPIHRFRRELLYLLERYAVVVMVGPTGSGKTTQLPQMLLQQGWTGIACTQPRRLAAIAMATRVSQEMQCGAVGGVVGYTVRFDDCTSPSTLCRYLTDGMLFRESLHDPLLSRYSVIMIDEAHERTIHSDLLLALLKKILVRRPELRVVISSATIDADIFKRYFTLSRRDASGKKLYGPVRREDADVDAVMDTSKDASNTPLTVIPIPKERFEPAVISLEGRTFPVDVFFLAESSEGVDHLDREDLVVDGVVQLVDTINRQHGAGDILVFLTGRQEIEKVHAQLCDQRQSSEEVDSLRFFKKKRSGGGREERSTEKRTERLVIDSLQLYAGMHHNDQLAVFAPAPPGHRKVILATNVAEASLTIDGIVFVIDTGREKMRVWDADLGMERMIVVPISQASAKQRAGRAGRTRPGTAFRLYTRNFFDRQMLPSSLPDLDLVNLTPFLLQLKALGIHNLGAFDFLSRPPTRNMALALAELHGLGALDDNARLSDPLGRQMAQLPLVPALARFFLEAARRACPREGAALAAMMTIQLQSGVDQHVFFLDSKGNTRIANMHRRLWVEEGDHMTLLSVFMSYLANASTSVKFCQKYHLNLSSLTTAHRVYNTLIAYLKTFGLATDRTETTKMTAEAISVVLRKSLIVGYWRNVAQADQHASVHISLDLRLQGQQVAMHPTSVLFRRLPALVLYGELLETTKMFIRYVSVIEPEWLEEMAPHCYDYKLVHRR